MHGLRMLLEDRRLIWMAWLVIGLECVAALYLLRPWAKGDSFHYLLLAQNLSQHHYGVVTTNGFEPDVLRPPGYPIVLWVQLHLLHLPPVAVVALQLCGTCGALFAIQRYLAKSGVNTAPFVILAAAYPFPLLYSAMLFAEAWATVAITAAALLLMRANGRAYAFAGAAAAVGALMRSDLLFVPVLLSMIVLLIERRCPVSKAQWIAKALVPSVAAALVLLPYAAWNYVHFHRASPAPIAGAVGTSLYLSTWQRDLTWTDVQAIIGGGSTQHIEAIGLGPAVREINRSIGAPENILAFDPWAYPDNHLRIAAAQAFRGAAIRRVEADPGRYAGHVAHNLWALWVTKRYDGVPAAVGIPLIISSAAVFLLGLAGMATALFRPGGWVVPAVLVPLTLYPAAIHLWLHTEARYTAATRPLLMMFAGAFLAWLLSRERFASGAVEGRTGT